VKVRRDNSFIVPFPDRFLRSSLHCAGADVTRHAPFAQMKVRYPHPLQGSLQIILAQFRSVHADRVISNIQDALDARIFQGVE